MGPLRSVTNKYVVLPQLPKRAQFLTADRVRGRQTVLESRHMHQADLEIDLLPAQGDELRDPQPMSVGEEEKGAIARTVAADLG
jgi:hypothetical protein